MIFDVNEWAYAYGKPLSTGLFKASTDDFMVDEVLSFELSGHGEHQFLRIEKRGLNTQELVKRVAASVGKPVKQISYAGLKDRQALTTQWLSVHCPGEDMLNAHLSWFCVIYKTWMLWKCVYSALRPVESPIILDRNALDIKVKTWRKRLTCCCMDGV
jgi:hypothetical protein